MENIVGKNIRKARERLGISARKLAARLNVTASFLSQVETGKTNPSLTNLTNISRTLNVSVGDLLGEKKHEPESRAVLKKEDIVFLKKMRGLQICLLSRKNINSHMQPNNMIFDEGADTGDFSQHFGQECGFVIKGRIKLFLDHEEYVLEEGDNFYYNSSIPHRFENIASGESKVFFTTSPPLY